LLTAHRLEAEFSIFIFLVSHYCSNSSVNINKVRMKLNEYPIAPTLNIQKFGRSHCIGMSSQ